MKIEDLPDDPERVFEQCQIDQDVLARLRASGDKTDIVRPIDVHFVGRFEALERLAQDASNFGFEVVGIEDYEESWSLDLRINLKTDDESIFWLTKTSVGIELKYDVEIDSWGCVSIDGTS